MTYLLFSKILREKLLDYLKWCAKKKNTKSQPKKIVCEIVNFGSTNLTNLQKISKNTTERYVYHIVTKN